jgi:hypothetical protein
MEPINGDQPKERKKYIAMANWEKYQHIDHGRAAPWCRWFAKTLRDEKWLNWSWSKRGVFSALLALRSDLGHNLPNDPPMIARMLSAVKKDAEIVTRTVVGLISDGVLILTNQQNGHENSGVEESREEKSREEKRTKSIVEPQAVLPGVESPPNGNGNGKAHLRIQAQESLGRVWDYYLEKLNRNAKTYTMTPLREAKGMARFNEAFKKADEPRLENAEAMMKLAIDRLAASAFHQGDNDRGRRYVDWERHLFSDASRFERWITEEPAITPKPKGIKRELPEYSEAARKLLDEAWEKGAGRFDKDGL